MKLKSFGMKMLSFSLFAMPCMVSAGMETSAIPANEQIVEGFGKHDREGHRHRAHKPTPLTLRDFAGEFVASVGTLGGLSAAPELGLSGVSAAAHGKLTIDTAGNGAFDFFEEVTFDGHNLIVDSAEPTITIAITDAAFGTMIVTDPDSGTTQTLKFIAIRAKDGSVAEIQAQPVSVSGSNSLKTWAFERYYQ